MDLPKSPLPADAVSNSVAGGSVRRGFRMHVPCETWLTPLASLANILASACRGFPTEKSPARGPALLLQLRCQHIRFRGVRQARAYSLDASVTALSRSPTMLATWTTLSHSEQYYVAAEQMRSGLHACHLGATKTRPRRPSTFVAACPVGLRSGGRGSSHVLRGDARGLNTLNPATLKLNAAGQTLAHRCA